MFRQGAQSLGFAASRLSLAANKNAPVQGLGQLRHIGGIQTKDALPTDFLGTPANRKELNEKRPVSPDLFGVDGKPHYKFPPIALSSITNRITGLALTAGMGAYGGIALTGDLPACIEGFKAGYPLLLPLSKFSIAFPFVYHTLGGFRHLVWDYAVVGFTNAQMQTSSYVLFGTSAAASAALAVATF